MVLSELISKLYDNLQDLPGESAHELLSPYKRPSAKSVLIDENLVPKPSAVAIIFYQKQNNVHFCLTQRPLYEGTHSGQISFPGGKMEEHDITLKHTALRETHEEIGLHRERINVLGELTQVYIPPSNFLVTPFLCYLDYEPEFILNHEVDEIIEPNILDLNRNTNLRTERVETKYGNFKVPAYVFNNKIVWGATALILSELEEILK